MATTSTHPQNVTGANYNNAYTQSYKYPEDVGGNTKEYPHYIRFIARKLNSASGSKVSYGEVDIYMPPDALKSTYSQSIGDVEMGTAIQIAEGSQSLGQFEAGLKKGIIEGFGETVSAAGNVVADTAKAATAQLVATAMSASSAKQAVEKATGKIINPHKAVVYQGPGGFREFSYTFVMVPKNVNEAKVIFNIVKFFKIRMHPGVGSAGINDISSSFLTYPDEFDIKYHVNNKEADGSDFTKPLFKIHRCFMSMFSADYTTSGLTSFTDDDQPLTTTISMTFKETQLLTKADINEGY